MEIGSIIAYGGSSAPAGYLLCDGATVSQTTYADLFAVVGHNFGADPGGGNFILPDLRGRVPLGVGTGAGLTARSLADSSGAEKITTVPEHNHTLRCNSGEGGSDAAVGRYIAAVQGGIVNIYATSENANMGANSIQNTGDAGGTDVMNPFLAVNFIIKT